MCGIAGILGRDTVIDQARAMVKAQRHRGPDDEGLQVLQTEVPGVDLILGHSRLSILDLSPAGHQPMSDEETGLWTVYNGEIYNHLEIREELPRRYRSTCDTETLLAAYLRWGRETPDRLRGMFAFAMWDPREQELFLCRDRLGVKPLYYSVQAGQFLFASEVRAILATDLVRRRLNYQALDAFLAFGNVPEPNTIVEGIYLLPAGSWMRVSASGEVRQIHRYWSSPFPTLGQAGHSNDCSDDIRRKVEEAVDCRLLSDVPLAVFLSGGVDSTAIVGSLSPERRRTIKTITLDFSERGYGEGAFAARVAEEFGTDHRSCTITSNDLLANWDNALAACDQPSIDGLNTHTVCRMARDAGLTVALCGHGGDELFGGYDNFRLIPRVLGFGVLPRIFREAMGRTLQSVGPVRVSTQKAASLLLNELDVYKTYSLARGVFWDRIRRRLFEDRWRMIPSFEYVENAVPRDLLASDPLNQVSQLELNFYLRNSLLRDTDVHSMAHGLEVRLPLLDHKLVEAVAPLPGRMKMSFRRPKKLLIDAMRDALPTEVVRRRKQGFVIPYQLWMRGALRSRLEQVLLSSDSALSLGLRPEQVQSVWCYFLEGSNQVNMQHPLALFVVLDWCVRHRVTL